MHSFRIEPNTYIDKAGVVRNVENIVLTVEPPMGLLEMPIKAVFQSDSKLLRYGVSAIIAEDQK